ncbi:MAG: potassium ABC transporter ATPase [Betaproteobacteria bacterium]|nr:potassium ABC transporter ATPase [Betaproteobacteria bacterium]
MDLIYLGVVAIMFGLTALFIYGCEKLRSR